MSAFKELLDRRKLLVQHEIEGEGRTLDQLNLQAGDQMVIPLDEEGEGLGLGWGDVLRWGLAITTSVVFGSQIFF